MISMGRTQPIRKGMRGHAQLADAQLRHERIEAHRVIKKVVESGMDQHSVYRYLEDRMGLQRDQLHIASSGIYYCRLVQQILKSLLERRCGTC